MQMSHTTVHARHCIRWSSAIHARGGNDDVGNGAAGELANALILKEEDAALNLFGRRDVDVSNGGIDHGQVVSR